MFDVASDHDAVSMSLQMPGPVDQAVACPVRRWSRRNRHVEQNTPAPLQAEEPHCCITQLASPGEMQEFLQTLVKSDDPSLPDSNGRCPTVRQADSAGDKAQRQRHLLKVIVDKVKASGTDSLLLKVLGQDTQVIEAKKGAVSSLRTFIDSHRDELALDTDDRGNDLVSLAGQHGVGKGNMAKSAGATVPTRRQRRRPEVSTECAGKFVWKVEVQNSTTAHASTDGVCSVKIVGAKGESNVIVLNGGGGMKTGDLATETIHISQDLGELVYVELSNTSATTWRPQWVKVFAPDGKEHFIYSRQWVAKNRTQKAYAEVSGSVGLRGTSGPVTGTPK